MSLITNCFFLSFRMLEKKLVFVEGQELENHLYVLFFSRQNLI